MLAAILALCGLESGTRQAWAQETPIGEEEPADPVAEGDDTALGAEAGDAAATDLQEPADIAMTGLTVVATLGEDDVPVRGATVRVQWMEEGELREKTSITAADGSASFLVPNGIVTIIAVASTTESFREDLELAESEETHRIRLSAEAR